MCLLTASFHAGVTAFDCGDIYTGVKEVYEKMMVARTEWGGRQQLGHGRSHKACPRFGSDFWIRETVRVTIAMVAIAYVLDLPAVGGVILGSLDPR